MSLLGVEASATAGAPARTLGNERRAESEFLMRYFVTVDIEGIAGVVHRVEGDPGNTEYERARRLMTQEANAVVAGIYDA
jgi:hypothetical protein